MNDTTGEEHFFKFRLYIAGDGPHSLLAVASLNKVCEEYLAMRHEIEIVDVLLHPERALEDGVLLTPLLIKLAPGKTQKILGNLAYPDKILIAMGLPTSP